MPPAFKSTEKCPIPNPVIPFEKKYKILSSVMNGKFSSRGIN
jgi:hypothetical protein